MSARSFLNTSHQTIGWFADQSALKKLTLRPPFQRRPVWTNEESSFLIDTILRGYPVPEVYVYSVPTDAGDDMYAVVDGQQRLRACLEYMADRFPLTFDVHKLEPLYGLAETPWFNKRFSELAKEERDRIRRYKLIVRDLEGVTDEELRHMFQRLNQSNMALNAQELRYSMYGGGLLGVVEKIVERPEWDHFRIFTKMQRRRMLDSEYVAELVVGYLHWPQNKKDNLDHYYRLYSPNFPAEKEVLERFGEVLSYLAELFPEPRMSGTRWYRKSDFYTLFLAVARGRINISNISIETLRASLVDLSMQVSHSPRGADSSPVNVYRAAVERAATDRARRVRREDSLVSFVAGLELVPASGAEYLTADEAVPDELVADELDEEYEDPE
ncbi:DUF262 domain-containing protein [Micromonospora deserti]|uniref:GmrSD restriction endonucleases N-terminal domain-containing protein n=1 Tax=Micromonospora deserti TaxID=2070366 RepID=A0A2W2BKX3_9ACTN|nr:DUF262 domain-containing protein [Micromonospora deserti]PZF88081.1 hypothetical protein C1I99_26860 [Micromonospora deserti]